MRPPRAAPLGAALLLATGCSQLQLASAGQTACAPKDIQISEVERGWSSEAWVATCGGKRYRCSSVASAWSVDYACKLDAETPMPDGAERPPADDAPPPETEPATDDDTDAASTGEAHASDEGTATEPTGTEPAAGDTGDAAEAGSSSEGDAAADPPATDDGDPTP